MIGSITALAPPLLFIAGACVGSFLNVVIVRYERGTSPLRGRSHCPACGRALAWWQLIPILSFIIIRGQCHRCGATIASHYPLVELAMGLFVMVLGTPLPTSVLAWGDVVARVVFVALLLVLLVIDVHKQVLPDYFIAVLVAPVVWLAMREERSLIHGGAGVLIGSGFLLLLWLLTRGQGIGLGDIKLMIPLGMLFGDSGAIILLLLAFWSGGLVALWLLMRGRATMKSAVPFGPFLIASAFLLLVWPQLIPRAIEILWHPLV